MGKMKASVKKKLVLFVIFTLFVVLQGCIGGNEYITVGKETLVTDTPDPFWEGEPSWPETKVIAVLPKGTRVKLVRRYYDKDFMSYKVKLKNYTIGYISPDDSQIIEDQQ